MHHRYFKYLFTHLRLYVMTSSYFLTTSSSTSPHPFFFFFLFSPSLSRLPLSPPSLVCVCMCVCCFFPSLFPPALKAALHHPPPLHFPFCFDLCNQGISCVRLMCFFSGYSGFPIHRLDMFGTGFLLFFFQGRTLPRAYCLFFLHHL